MSQIKKGSITRLGFDFIPQVFIPKGKDENHHRFEQNPRSDYRNLTVEEIVILIENGNRADNWENILVSESFIPYQIRQSNFFGLVRIGHMAPTYLEYRNLKLESGIYNSTIVSSDLGDYVAIHHVRYMSHFIIGNDVILSNISEMETSSTAKFGNGVLREGEAEDLRIALELCNENGVRSILPFDGMQAADAYLWTRNRQDTVLQHRFKELTEKRFSTVRGTYSMIGDRCIIKNSQNIKNVQIGSDAYIKGINKLKNLTINSSPEAFTQIGEGCELVNGIVGYGCRIFYGVKAVRFILSSFSQLKYGARLINSFLGDNSTISCCEVLNSLIFPAHEQHHNNSFLCAATIMGQSNMAAGATVGSNHNSRAADGEIIAGRGFWPGLCVSLKHNSRFASYTLLVKGDFPYEMDIPIPFSLVNNDVKNDKLMIIPGYWFMYNMYALVRNANKYASRDKRLLKNQYLEYDMLAPDTINELFNSLRIIELEVGSQMNEESNSLTKEEIIRAGRAKLTGPLDQIPTSVLVKGFEHSKRKVELVKIGTAYPLFKRFIKYYGTIHMIDFLETHSFEELKNEMTNSQRLEWENIGGQLIEKNAIDQLLREIKSGKIDDWEDIHKYYHELSRSYLETKRAHAFASLLEITDVTSESISIEIVQAWLKEAISHRTWMVDEIYASRAKDYENPFRNMVYNSEEERDLVVGKLSENSFILQQRDELNGFVKCAHKLISKLSN
ncbi:DUF4954 family protein [Sphingobacterium sp. IITKGP-BTPF85]|uniref:DUF4954 family protein n=1 Tax=Sphingobacterium sp. IITKGP-BTPF85 TaxID=1338009 RepID=UPI0004130DA9|nr:DUF4954 family protein [Sphingobacterium sp. IITKGP-BTPF85]KKX49287.1 hypothetical protein L950_0216275 [Sphingobacterium sp. IITKGP-BTPF85]